MKKRKLFLEELKRMNDGQKWLELCVHERRANSKFVVVERQGGGDVCVLPVRTDWWHIVRTISILAETLEVLRTALPSPGRL